MNILAITHSTSNTGAPKVCLNTLRYLKKKINKLNIVTVSLESSLSLEKSFIDCSNSYITLDKLSKKHDYSLINRIKSKLKNKKIDTDYDLAFKFLYSQDFQFIYANTIASLKLAYELKMKNSCVKIILFIHELPTVIEQLCPDFINYIKQVDLIVYISEFNRNYIENYYRYNHKNYIEILPFTFSENSYKKKSKKIKNVVMMGSVHWRKGDDIFIQVARKVLAVKEDVNFYWIGSISNYHKSIIDSDIEKLKIKDKVFFIGEIESPMEILSEMDVFLLTSREEPFGLAAAEAVNMEIPCIYFKDVTGIGALFEENNIDLGVPYLDIDKMTSKLIKLLENEFLLKDFGKKMKNVLVKYNEEYIDSKLSDVLSKI